MATEYLRSIKMFRKHVYLKTKAFYKLGIIARRFLGGTRGGGGVRGGLIDVAMNLALARGVMNQISLK